MPQFSTILLTTKGESRKANLQLTDTNELNMDIIQKYFKKKEVPERICYYEHDNKILFVFGYKTGKKGKESKTQLPQPNDAITLYGDALIIVSLSSKWESPIPYTVDQWTSFCSQMNNTNNNNDSKSVEDSDSDSDSELDDVLSDIGSEKSVKDDYDDDDSTDKSLIESDDDDEELEPEPVVVKKKKAAVFNTKTDSNTYKDDIQKDAEPESNKIRTTCLTAFNFLAEQFPEEAIRKLERAIFLEAIQNAQKHYIPKNWKSPNFCELYRQIVRSVLSNIHPQSPVANPRLLTRVKEGEFELESIATMTSYEMYPEKWFALKDKLLQREQKILEGNKSRATDQFKCRRCNKRECTYYELQTRSADEPMTIFITCLNCGKEWRQGG